MRILLIGGEGYIGNVVAQHFLKNKDNYITSYDKLLYGNNLCVLNKKQFDNYKFVYGDMLETDILLPQIKNADAVVLLAGLVGDPITKKYSALSKKINDLGVKNVIDLCASCNIKNFIFISTCSNYGLIKSDRLADEEFELNPLSLYAKSKVRAEKYILSFEGKTKMNPTILRFATAFGLSPRMRFDLTISEFTRTIALGKSLLVYDSETWRPYCHVKDFALLIEAVLFSSKSKVAFEVFNAGADFNNATKQMIVDKIVKRIPDANVKFQKHGNDPRNYRVDFSKVNSVLGFLPKYTIDDGIEELISCMKDNVFDLVDENENFYGNYSINYD